MLELVLLCAGCHGMAGEGRPEAGYPRLAGQPEAYLVRQLDAYADGRRKSAVMEPLARSLSAQERTRLAREFSARTPLHRQARPLTSPRGEALARVGDEALRVQACQNCHGPLGRGQAPYGPSLAGLSQEYLRAELHAFRSGARATDPSGQMPALARRLPEQDVAAVAAYYAGLPVPVPQRIEPLPRHATQPPTRADVGREPSQGKDEQGSGATTGGAQGPAGGSTQR